MRAPVRSLLEQPGKGWRTAMLLACATPGARDVDRVVRSAAVVELLHTASLLHDDVIDRSVLRRGVPTAFASLGSERAVLAGLACFAAAGLHAATLGVATEQAVSRTVAGLAYGELLDLERAFDVDLDISDYVELVERKTGDLFGLACLLGAAEALVSRSDAEVLAGFGTQFGVAFQVLDDCLDLDGRQSGKPTGTDHLLGLFGAPTLMALRRDDGVLRQFLLRPVLTSADLPRLADLVADRGGVAEARVFARRHFEAALDGLDRLSDPARAARMRALGTRLWAGAG